MNDHAANENKRVAELSKLKKERAESLRADLAHLIDGDEFELTAFEPITSANCNHHKLMLLAKAIRDADHLFLKGILPEERDVINREFKTTNILDMAQIQCHKMFGHVLTECYAFGNGIDKFPEWMKRTEGGDAWRGLKRLVGNRSGIFLENAVVTYYMAGYYRNYCKYVQHTCRHYTHLHSRALTLTHKHQVRFDTTQQRKRTTQTFARQVVFQGDPCRTEIPGSDVLGLSPTA